MDKAILLLHLVQKTFSYYFSLQNNIFASNSERKSDLQMCWMALRVMHYPLKLFFRQYIINLQQWLKLVWYQRRFKRDFPVVSPFKNSSFFFYVENVPDPTQIQKCHVKNLKCYKKHTPGQKFSKLFWNSLVLTIYQRLLVFLKLFSYLKKSSNL